VNASARLRSATPLLALTAGTAVANIYYAQPLLPTLAAAFAVTPRAIGLVATAAQVGYGTGLFLFVPLGDALERRGLILRLLAASVVALLATALAPSLPALAVATFVLGVVSVVPQLAVPLAAHLAPSDRRGRAIGAVMTGLLLGILLARTVSGIVGQWLGWRAVFALAAVACALLGLGLRRRLPRSPPDTHVRWRDLMSALVVLPLREPALREAAILGGFGMATFSALWATLAFRLQAAPHHLGPQAAGLFGLLGAAGALAAGAAGRLGDRFSPRMVGGAFLTLSAVSWLVLLLFDRSIVGLAAGVVLLDLGVQGSHISNLARIHSLPGAERSRRNTVYMVAYFAGGAGGTALATFAWSRWAWPGAVAVGAAAPVAALAVWVRGFGRVALQREIEADGAAGDREERSYDGGGAE
jgi:predicted MFS family arabinose efflux permease